MTIINIYKVVVTTFICLAVFTAGRTLFDGNLSKDTAWGVCFAGILYLAAAVGMWI